MSLSILPQGEKPTLSLRGDSFYFCGTLSSIGRFHNPEEVLDPQVQDIINEKNAFVFVVLGSDKCYFRCTSPRDGDVEAACDSNLENYEGLTEFLFLQNAVRPLFLSLGCNGHFFVRTENGRKKWDVSADVTLSLFQKHADDEGSLEALWLGHGDAFVAQHWDGTKVFDLQGKYPGLQEILESRAQQPDDDASDIASLAMDTENGIDFVILWRDGTANHSRRMKNTFLGRTFERWCATNGFSLST